MLGAIIGDVIGSVYEQSGLKTTDFELFTNESHFTDDTVLTVAVMEVLLHGRNYVEVFQEYGQTYPKAGFSKNFRKWIADPKPYNANTNGSAMRVSPIAWYYATLPQVQAEAKASALVSHNHPEGIKGAVATASAIFMARDGASKTEIKNYIEQEFGYNLSRNLDDIRPSYGFDYTSAGSVPEAMIAFLESFDFEEAIINAVSLGGDADTQASIAGALAEAFYKQIPDAIAIQTIKRLPAPFLELIDAFYANI